MKFLKSLSTYALVGFVGAGINFFLMPYLSHFLSPEDYGILSVFNSYVTLFVPIVGLVAAGLITVEYYQIKDKHEFASLFSSIQIVPLIPLAAILLVFLLFQGKLVHWLDIGASSPLWLYSIPVLAFLTVYIDCFLSFLIIEKKPTLYAVFNLTKLFLEIGLTILFVTRFHWGWQGRMLSWLITITIFTIISFIYFGKINLWTSRIKKKYIVAGIAYGSPLILHTIGKFVINQSDRLFIAKMISPAEAGIYSAGYQIGSVLLIIITAIHGVITPFIFERLSDLNEQKKIEIVRMSYLFVGIMLVCLLGITVCTPFYFKYFMAESYSGGTAYVFWVALGYFFWGIYIIFSGYVFYLKKTGLLAVFAIVNVITNIVFNYLFINMFGPLGAAYATCLSFIIVAACVAVVANKYYPLPWLRFREIVNK